MANARTETAIARNILTAARAEALADAGIAQATFKLGKTSASNSWNLDGVPHRLQLLRGEVVIRLHDEAGKINPNFASQGLMSALLEVSGVDRALAQRLGASIAQSVVPTSEMLPLDVQQYRDAYPRRNAPLESIDELQWVVGMTPAILDLVRPNLTIYTQTDRLNTKNASPLVRRAVELSLRDANRIAGLSHGLPLSSAVPEKSEAGWASTTSTFISGTPAETIVEIEVRAREPGGGIFVRNAVLKIDSSHATGYVVLDWHRGELVK